MRSLLTLKREHVLYHLVTGLFVLATCANIQAQNGTWTNLVDGQWESTTNWTGGTIANGANNTADFNTLNIVDNGAPFNRTFVGITNARTIGHLVFGDTNLSSAGAWEVYAQSGTPDITLAGTAPSITVNQLTPIDTGTPPLLDDVIVRPPVAGTSGFAKNGVGILTLAGTNTITGGININAGTLRLPALSAMPVQTISMANNTTLETAVTVRTVTVAAGATATVRATNTASIALGGILPAGAGSTLNFRGSAGQIDAQNDWTGFQNVNLIGEATARTPMRLTINNTPSFTGASFTNTNLHIDNFNLFVRTNSQGNDIPIGRLTGTATGQLSGGNAGTAVRYVVGGLGTSSTFEGTINGAGGLSLNKVGAGTLTLAGPFTGTAALQGQNPARTAGVFRVTEGSLKLTGAAAIPGGAGTALTTIDVLAGATFDVTSTPGTFTTSALQKIQGSGTVLGNYDHADGWIHAGDVGAPTAANEGNLSAGVTPTAGTINFNGNLSLNGGSIRYDMSPTPAGPNDLVHVTGTTTVSGGKIVPNFLGTPPTSGTYTVVTSDTGFSGTVSSLTVDWPGRGANPTVTQSGNSLVFTAQPFGAGGSLIWTGANSTAWDIETTQNWTNGGSPDRFFNLVDSVTFNESAANKTVDLATIVTPTSVTVNNTTPYTIQGTGAITGATGFTKTGAGTLNFRTANNFTGPSSVQGSTVDIQTFGTALGAGPLTLDNATVIAINGGGLGNSGVTVTGNNTLLVDGTVGTNNAYNVPNLTGTGTINITSTVADKWFTMNGIASTVNVNLTGVDAGTFNHVRFAANSSFRVLNVNDTRISGRSGTGNSTSILSIGELHSDTNTRFNSFEGGSPAVHAVLQIGSLNTASDFNGPIQDGTGSGGTTSVSHVKKVGTGTLTLTGANAYTGNTVVLGGTLSVTNPTLSLANTADVIMNSTAIFNLNFSGTDDIRSLFINGIGQVSGTWGRIGSGAANERSFFTGDGILNVLAAATTSLLGDYNADGVVDARDYVTYRDNVGTTNVLPNNPYVGIIGDIHFDTWRENYGRTLGPGGGSGFVAVPEPGTCVLAALALAFCRGWRRRK